MPPKLKIYQSTGKTNLKNGSHNSMQNGPASLTPEQEDQLQVELYWCINQLQTALSSGKLNNKQVVDHTKALNTLMSRTSSVVQKRQVMRLSFGNYREKIAAAEEKASKALASMKVKPAKPDKKSVFVKKSLSLSHGKHNFTFNFPTPTEENDDCENRTNATEGKREEHNATKENLYHYVPSDNTFRFKFEFDSEEQI